MAATDNFVNYVHAMGASSRNWEAITPSDSTDLNYVTRGIYVGGDGNINAVAPDGTVVLFSGAKAGSVLPLEVARVKSTSTTATGLVGLR